MKSIDKLVRGGKTEELEKLRLNALATQNAGAYARISNEVGLTVNSVEDPVLYEHGLVELREQESNSGSPYIIYNPSSPLKERPSRLWVAFNYAKQVPKDKREYRGYDNFADIPMETKSEKRKAGTVARERLGKMFPLDVKDVDNLGSKLAIKMYYTVREVFG